MTWHHGFRYQVRNGHRWSNRWLTHPCRDLALPFELGVRAYHHPCTCPCHHAIQPGVIECPKCGGD